MPAHSCHAPQLVERHECEQDEQPDGPVQRIFGLVQDTHEDRPLHASPCTYEPLAHRAFARSIRGARRRSLSHGRAVCERGGIKLTLLRLAEQYRKWYSSAMTYYDDLYEHAVDNYYLVTTDDANNLGIPPVELRKAREARAAPKSGAGTVPPDPVRAERVRSLRDRRCARGRLRLPVRGIRARPFEAGADKSRSNLRRHIRSNSQAAPRGYPSGVAKRARLHHKLRGNPLPTRQRRHPLLPGHDYVRTAERSDPSRSRRRVLDESRVRRT